ncbi:B12-binding domain-containing radical SAM protein [[Clostridium] polysaccharolyticum]|uniref:Radical SAM superfamily enzyme YgiQ, UPF0313 family n=1 Tax=[Clostridium] polysaccharolyticum TaxID=29364 RepID=A0A1I0BEU6_9FIRM|nr:radical SAM protein [[Clostridium] polysaccharolyticum]SET05031.1 Radical SAM superfamily enzyme YgiQ, UPF0313 family [[Clostridium] polysaccharolyticum]
MKFNEIFLEEKKIDVLMIQPPVLKHVAVEQIDVVQTHYWEESDKIGSLIGDLPIEPNWGLLFLSSALKNHLFTTQLIDFHLYDYVKYEKTGEFITEKDMEEVLKKKKFKIVCLSSLTRSSLRAMEIAKICKKLNPECVVIAGGIHFTFVVEDSLKNCDSIDIIVKGEGEEILPELVKRIIEDKDWTDLTGIAYRNEAGEIINDKMINHIYDINQIPLPDYDQWPEDVPLIPRIYLSRGCIGDCDYCVVNQLFLCDYRKRELKDVIAEIKMVHEKYGCTEMLIGDLCFPCNKKDTIEFCKLLIESGVDMKWWCQTRPNILDDETLGYLKKAGCVQVAIGIESVEEEVLQKTNSKKYDANKDKAIDEICAMVKKYDIAIQGYFIIGLPGDTLDTCISTIKLLDKLTAENLVDVTHISVMVPYPGTDIMSNHERYGMEIVDNDYSHYLMNCDLMNAGVPVYVTDSLDNYQIYSLWQLALSTVAKNYKKRNNINHLMFDKLENFVVNMKLLPD